MKCTHPVSLATAAGLSILLASPGSAQTTIGPDAFGYEATDGVTFAFEDIAGTGTVVLDSASAFDDTATAPIGFSFDFYGTTYTDVFINENGCLSFGTSPGTGAGTAANIDLTVASPPSDAPTIAILWDDWDATALGVPAVLVETRGTAPNRRFIVQWEDVFDFFAIGNQTFQLILFEGSNEILFQYQDVVSGNAFFDHGVGATVGIRNTGGHGSGDVLQWSFNSATLMDGDAIRFEVVGSTNVDPICDAGTDVTLECDSPNGAFHILSGTASDPDGPVEDLTFQWDVTGGVVLDDPTILDPSAVFPVGVTTATLTVTDANGGMCTSDVVITVEDTTPPEIKCRTNRRFLWIPNHRMRKVKVFVEATDDCTAPEDIMLVLVTVRSNEPDDAPGGSDGHTTGDVNGQDGFTSPVPILLDYNPAKQRFEGHVKLRAERDRNGNGRRYTIDVEAFDSNGNYAITSCVVIVPRLRWWWCW